MFFIKKFKLKQKIRTNLTKFQLTKDIAEFRKINLKKNFQHWFCAPRINTVHAFLFQNNLLEDSSIINFLIEGVFCTELTLLPFKKTKILLVFGLVDQQSSFYYLSDSEFFYYSKSGDINFNKFRSAKGGVWESGDVIKSKIIFPNIQTPDRCLIQEISYSRNFTKFLKNQYFTGKNFSLKSSKKELIKNGQFQCNFFSSYRIGLNFPNFFSSFLCLVKLNQGPEYRFHERNF